MYEKHLKINSPFSIKSFTLYDFTPNSLQSVMLLKFKIGYSIASTQTKQSLLEKFEITYLSKH